MINHDHKFSDIKSCPVVFNTSVNILTRLYEVHFVHINDYTEQLGSCCFYDVNEYAEIYIGVYFNSDNLISTPTYQVIETAQHELFHAYDRILMLSERKHDTELIPTINATCLKHAFELINEFKSKQPQYFVRKWSDESRS